MARPTKAVVDYFPHNCNYGITIPILQQKFGLIGYAVWFKLLEQLGKTENHYIDCRDDDIWLFLTSETMVEESLLQEILDLCARMNAIDKELWKEKIIFSENFINGIKDAYRNRKDKFVTKENLLRKLSLSNVVSYEETMVSDEEMPQSKVKENKEKESKVDNPPISPDEKNEGGQINFDDLPKINPDDFLTIPCDQIQKKYNELCKKLTPIGGLTNSRRKLVIERWRENPSLEFWEDVFKKANDICLSSGWKPTFDWIFTNDTNYMKVLEGNFDKTGGSDESNRRVSGITLETSEFARLARERRAKQS